MREFEIPDEAQRAAWDEYWYQCTAGIEPETALRLGVAAAAPLILAARLERLASGLELNARACQSFGVTDFAEGRSNGLRVAVERLRAEIAELRTPAAVTPEPAGPREPGQPRVFPPDSAQPSDVAEVVAENGVHFRGVGDFSPLRSWCALEDSGGDGQFYTWWALNSTSSPNGPYTLTEVPAVPPAEPGAGA